MLSIGLVASGRAAMQYFLGRGAGCEVDYYTRPGGERGRWIGRCARLEGLEGSLDGDGEVVLRRLLEGQDQQGRQLVPAVRRSDPRAQLPAAPLIAAVRTAAEEAGVPVPFLLDDHRLADAFAALTAALDGRRPTRPRGVRADTAVAIAEAVGLDARQIYGDAGRGGVNLVDRALKHVGERVDVRRAGLDLTFSAPKSVSILLAFAPASVAEQVHAAHETATKESVAWLERWTAFAARGHQGDGQRADRVGTYGFIAAAFDHSTSRAGDPQLHTHVVVANLLRGYDDRWSALDSRALHRHAKTAGYLYQAVLRSELTNRLGVDWGDVTKGTAELVGVPREVRRLFSKRSTQVTDAMRAKGASGSKAAQVACLDTRPAKDHASSPADLLDRWTEELLTAGHDPGELVRGCLEPGTQPHERTARQILVEFLGPEGLTKHATTFDLDDLLQRVAEALPAGAADVTAIEEFAERTLTATHIRPIANTSEFPQWTARWTTDHILGLERVAMDSVEALRRRPGVGEPADVVESAIAEHNLASDQAAMVRALTRGDTSLHVVIGPAGSGKTAALAAANAAWQQSGRPVVGAALSALASRELARGAGIQSGTVAALLSRLETASRERTGALQAGSIVVIDEAGMVGTSDYSRLLRHVQFAHATLVLVGDPAQLPEIEAGGLFTALARSATAELRSNHRQDAQWEREALAGLRDGRVGDALDAYQAHDRVHISATVDELRDRIVADYLTEATRDRSVAILAATRAQVRAYNDAVRERLVAAGELSGPELAVGHADGEVCLRAGDRVMVTRNDYDTGLLNGDRAVITDVDPSARSVTLTTDDGHHHELSSGWLAEDRLDHAYAVTCHKAQGQTLDATLVAGSAALTSETAYVALSRGRRANHLYLAPEPGRDDAAQEWLTDTVLSDASRRMRSSRRQVLATEQLEPGALDRPKSLTTRRHTSRGRVIGR